MQALDLLWIALGGALGSLMRYGVAQVVQSRSTLNFPIGTLAVNLMGCVLFGMAFGLGQRQAHLSRACQIVMIGFLGGLTTFSAFVNDTHTLFSQERWMSGLGNVALQVGLSWLGLMLGLRLIGRG